MTKTLADILTEDDAVNNGNQDFLDLSPAAQQYLSNKPASAAGFVLTPEQKNKLAAILDKYKGQELTQDVFNQIQDDLKAAGLGVEQLKALDQIKSFEGVALLMQALNGTAPDIQTTQVKMAGDGNNKANNYMQQIISALQNGVHSAASASE